MEIVGTIIKLLGGLAMFLYGVEVMGDGLKNCSGSALKRILEKLTGNALTGMLTGVLVTAIIQSSTATIVLAVALIAAGVLSLKQAVSVVLGANIGTTVTAQITRLAFVEAGDNWFLFFLDTDILAPIALVIGIVLIVFVKTKKAKTAGDISIGFGILFVGIMSMTGAVSGLAKSETFLSLLEQLSASSGLGLLSGIVLTVIVQSSSATIAMLQSLSSTGALDLAAAYPIIMGINIGTCIVTAFYCFVGNTGTDSKRTGVVHVAFNCIGTIVFIIGMTVVHRLGILSEAFWSRSVDSGTIANFQTLFNLVTAILLLPFTNSLVSLSKFLVREKAPKQSAYPELYTLSEKLYISPSVAVYEATKAVAAMGTLAKENLAKGCKQLIEYSDALTAEIDSGENELDNFADNADRFLIGLSKAVENESDDRQIDLLMQTVPNFERVGDYATNMVELAQKLRSDGLALSDTAKQELTILFSAIDAILEITVQALLNGDMQTARTIEPLEEVIDDMVMVLRDRHTKRLKSGACSVESGIVFMETLTYLERASDHCSSAAVMMLARNDRSIQQNHYDYLQQIHSGNDENYVAQMQMRRAQYLDPILAIKE